MRNSRGWVIPLPCRRPWLALLALALAVLPACAPRAPGASGPFPQFAEFEDLEVREVQFVGELELPADSLRDIVITRATRCSLVFLPVCLPFTSIGRDVYQLDLQELASDVTRLQLYYRDHGYYGTRIAPSVDRVGEDGVAVRFAIAPGDRVVLRELDVQGTEEVLDSAVVRRIVPLRVGEPFRRIDFLRSADTIRTELLRRGHAYADVLRNYSLDTIADVAEAQFIALPGPLVYVDTVLFAGLNRLSESTLRKQIPLEEGELLRLPDLSTSQRNLYELPMVSFASLEIAPDSLQRDADSTRTTILARVVEAPQYVVDASVGIGTVECVRTEARYLDRNFLGGGRSLELTGVLSKIGVGEPLAVGLEDNLCAGADSRQFGGRDFSRYLDYRVAASFLQPRLLNTRTELGLNAHVERLTELNAFLRQSVGGQVVLARDIGLNKLLNATLSIQNGRTLANPVVFCIGFDICTAQDVEQLEERRWSNSLSATAAWDRRQTAGPISRGFVARGTVDWASPVIGSDDRYLRALGEGSLARPLRPGWVLAGNLRLGGFLTGGFGLDDGYIPPERRFYAGGPNSVRGFDYNALGPTAYVWYEQVDEDGGVEADTAASAVGGTRMVVSSVELRGPSPFFTEFFRVAAFVDAGQVWAPEADFDARSVRVTPGVGLRVVTPIGPVRLDVAYNGYPYEVGPLYYVQSGTQDLQVIDDRFRPDDDRGFWRRLRFSFGVGQAF